MTLSPAVRLLGALAILASLPAPAAAAAPYLVKDLDTGTVPASFSEMVAANDTLFFSVTAWPWGDTLWRSDGTADGTQQLLPEPYESRVSTLQVVRDLLFFAYVDARGNLEAWRSDGTRPGTFRLATLIRDVPLGPDDDERAVYGFVEAGGTVFFASCVRYEKSCALWASDGTEPGTRRLTDFSPITGDRDEFDAPRLSSADGMLLFVVGDSDGRGALWRSDGTPEGTVPATDTPAFPLPQATGPWDLQSSVEAGGMLFFADGSEVWRSDGSTTGTIPLVDFGTVPADGFEWGLAAVGDVVLFSGYGADGGLELWRTDGTPAGTSKVIDVPRLPAGSAPTSFTAVGSTLFFTTTELESGRHLGLWKSDGTAAGTVRVKDIDPVMLVDVRGTLFFTASEPMDGLGLWKSDGTDTGTVRVADLAPSYYYPIGQPATIDGTLFFTLDWLWRSDGTAAGTVQVPLPTYPYRLFPSGAGTLFLAGQDPATGATVLWTSDGTFAGTVRVTTPFPERYSTIDSGIGIDGTLYFTVSRSGTSVPWELWRTDGTATGTVLVTPLPGYATSLTAVGARILFTVSGTLWTSDGTAVGTVEVAGAPRPAEIIVGLDGSLLFSLAESGGGFSLWRSDGTCSGTFRVSELFPGWRDARNPTIVDGKLFFAAGSPEYGTELWALPLSGIVDTGHPEGTCSTTTTTTVAPSSTTTSTLPCLPGSCEDDDPCTLDRCEAGGCSHEPRMGLEAARCVLSGATLEPPVCMGQRGLRRIRRRLDRARELIDRAPEGTDLRQRRPLVRRATRNLAVAARLVAEARRRRISGECAAALARVIADAGGHAEGWLVTVSNPDRQRAGSR